MPRSMPTTVVVVVVVVVCDDDVESVMVYILSLL